jgi:adenosylcobinamide-phosphate synthase
MTVVLGLTGFGIGALFERAATLSPGAWLFLPAALAAGLAVLRPVAEAARALALLERPAGALALEERRVLPAQTIEQVAAGLNAGLVAPLFWYALLGLPGLGLYTALSAAGRAVAQPSVPRSAFGETPRRLALIIDLVPLWISGLVFLAASLLVPRCSPAAGIRALSAAVTRPGWIIANPAIAILAGLLRTELANHRADRGAGWNFAVGLGVGPPLAPQLRAAMALYGVAVIQALLGFLLTVYLAARVS